MAINSDSTIKPGASARSGPTRGRSARNAPARNDNRVPARNADNADDADDADDLDNPDDPDDLDNIDDLDANDAGNAGNTTAPRVRMTPQNLIELARCCIICL